MGIDELVNLPVKGAKACLNLAWKYFSPEFAVYQTVSWGTVFGLRFLPSHVGFFNSGSCQDAVYLGIYGAALTTIIQPPIYVLGERLKRKTSVKDAAKEIATLRAIELGVGLPVAFALTAGQYYAIDHWLGPIWATFGTTFGPQTLWNVAIGARINNIYRGKVAMPPQIGPTLGLEDIPYLVCETFTKPVNGAKYIFNRIFPQKVLKA